MKPSLLEPPVPAVDHRHGVNRITYSTDGRRRAHSDVDLWVQVWEGDRQRYSGYFGSLNDKVRPTQRVRGLAFAPEAPLLFVAAADRVQAIDLEWGRPVWTYEPPRSFGFLIVSPLALDVDDRGRVAIAYDNGTLGVWDRDGHRLWLQTANDAPRYLKFVPRRGQIVGSDSFWISVWDAESGATVSKLSLRGRAFNLAVDEAGEFAATRGLYSCRIWHLGEGEMVADIPVGEGLPLVQFHPRRRLLALSERRGVNLVDDRGRFLTRLDTGGATVLAIAFHPEGDRIAVGCSDASIREWSLREVLGE
jgi:WD40 repeat protein